MRRTLISIGTAIVLLFGSAAVATPAQASPVCSIAKICGSVEVHGSSVSSCTVSIDGNWADGSAGKHYALWDQSGYNKSTRWFKDTDGLRVSSSCKGIAYSLRSGKFDGKVYNGGTWYKISDITHARLKLVKK